MRKFQVHYHTTCDENGQPSEDYREIQCENEDQAEMMIEYDLEKSFPDGVITIKSVKPV